ncbi:unnamed protein product [Urochloa humidicola]
MTAVAPQPCASTVANAGSSSGGRRPILRLRRGRGRQLLGLHREASGQALQEAARVQVVLQPVCVCVRALYPPIVLSVYRRLREQVPGAWSQGSGQDHLPWEQTKKGR